MQTNVESCCPRAVCKALDGRFDDLLSREWLITNGLGGFASGTVVGCPTRRYHGLMVMSRRPPLERVLLWAHTVDQIVVGKHCYELPCFEFSGAVHPSGYVWQKDFDFSAAVPAPWVKFVYVFDGVEVAKRVTLLEDHNLVEVRYEVYAINDLEVDLNVIPLIAGRDYHSLLRGGQGCGWDTQATDTQVWMKRWDFREAVLAIDARVSSTHVQVSFEPHIDWWYSFHYRQEAHRGLDCSEDLFTPGRFNCRGRGSFCLTLLGVVGPAEPKDAAAALESNRQALARARRAPHGEARPALAPVDDMRIEQLYEAAGQFVVRRDMRDGSRSTTILAGYPWFGDWGRDTFIALPGLLLTTGRFDEARQVLTTFAATQQNGLIPNLFDDYGNGCHYNSVDAALWYVHAADAYVEATGDLETWQRTLQTVCLRMVESFERGTDFDIRVDQDGLLKCGNPQTQITWMDAKCGDVVFTPRYGKPVEINALWYHALCILAARLREAGDSRYRQFEAKAAKACSSFDPAFWNATTGGLNDCVRDDGPDPAVRPNQIFAVSLPHSPLSRERQRNVLACVIEHLLTPYGLRTLSPADSRYRPRYEGNPFERDGAYHQGTVWPWLMGPFVEAYLRVHDFSPRSREHCRQWLNPLLEHLSEAGLGSVSEVYDGNPPHRPGGAIAQAWSVAEVLRAWTLIQNHAPAKTLHSAAART